jgi:hypothetical protein
MRIRLCFCHRDAEYVTVGSLPEYLCSSHVAELASTVKVERFFQDGDGLPALLRDIARSAVRAS